MKPERLAEIKARHEACTKISNFAEWNTLAHDDRGDLLEELEEQRKRFDYLWEQTRLQSDLRWQANRKLARYIRWVARWKRRQEENNG
jgi:hypothetical protein